MATALGVPVRAVQAARVKKLARGTDWALDGTTVLLAEKSLPALTTALGLAMSPLELALLAEKSRAGGPVEFEAVVVKFPANPKLLTVRWLEEGTERTANVVTNRRDNFRVRMVVPIRLNAVTERYELTRPAPRQKGRW